MTHVTLGNKIAERGKVKKIQKKEKYENIRGPGDGSSENSSDRDRLDTNRDDRETGSGTAAQPTASKR